MPRRKTTLSAALTKVAWLVLLSATPVAAQDSYVQMGPAGAGAYFLKPQGAPQIAEGRVKPGQFFFRQPVAYVRTGILSHDLTLIQPNTDYRLPAGTALFFRDGDWCTTRGTERTQVCLSHQDNQWFWRQADHRLHLGCLFHIGCVKDGPPQLRLPVHAPDITETTLPPAFVAEGVISETGDNAYRITAQCRDEHHHLAYDCYGTLYIRPGLVNSDLVLSGGNGTGARLHFDDATHRFTVTKVATQ